MQQRRLLLPDESRDREKWQQRGLWCYRIACMLLIVLLLLAAITEGFPILQQPYFSFVKRWMSTGVALAILFAIGGFIFNRDQ